MSAKRAILVVDDEAILLLSIRQELKLAFGADFLYETALSAEEGLRSIERLESEGVSIALVISDWLMPGMRGDEFLIRVRGRQPEVKLVLLSGHADNAQMERLSAEAGLFAYLGKPYKPMELKNIVHGALREASL